MTMYPIWRRREAARFGATSLATAVATLTAGLFLGAASASGVGAPSGMDPDELIAIGERVYENQCIQCHKADGLGGDNVAPALAGSDYVLGDREAFIFTVLDGRHVEAFIMGAPGSPMQSYADLSNEELAGVLTYIRNSWGNDDDGGDVIQPDEVEDAR